MQLQTTALAVASLVASVALSACGSSSELSAEPDRVDGARGDEPTPSAAGGDTPRGFTDNPVVRFPAPAVITNIETSCIEVPRPISRAEAVERGFDADGDVAALEQSWDGGVFISGEQVTRTTLHLKAQVDGVWLVEYRVAPGSSLRCPASVLYGVTVQLYTNDGALAGAFHARQPATPAGDVPNRLLEAASDLRNFSGSLPVVWDGAPDVFGTADISWGFESGAEVFSFQPRVWHATSGSCSEPDCTIVASNGDLLSMGVNTSETGTFADRVADLGRYVDSPVSSTLDRFAAELGPYRPNVSVWVVAPSAQATRVQARARVAASEFSATVNLAYDWRRVVEGYVAGWLDLGPLDEGTEVDVAIEDMESIGDVQSNVLVGGCPVANAYDRCKTPGCTAHSTLTVVSAACDPFSP